MGLKKWELNTTNKNREKSGREIYTVENKQNSFQPKKKKGFESDGDDSRGEDRRRNNNRGSSGENRIPNLRKSPNYNSMVRRRIQLQKTPKKSSQIVFGVNLVLQNHLHHRMPEIEIRIVGILFDGDALAAGSSESAEGDGGSGVGIGVGEGRGVGIGGGGGEAVVVVVVVGGSG